MKRIKTLTTKNLKDTVKRVGVASARLLASLPARHPAPWETRVVRINNLHRNDG